MKKFLPIAAALVFALAGCGSPQQAAEESTTEPEAIEETAEESTVDEGNEIEWIEVSSAEEAAKGAGFEKFGVLDKFRLGDLEFANPTFAYAGGVAQATYETPATAFFFRKAVETYTTPLSDRELDTFAAHWHKVIDGFDVTCYGPAKGAVTVATWTDGVTSYALTFQGLGGEEMSMDVDELAAIVKGVAEANADKNAAKKAEEETKTEEKKEETSTETKSSLISDAEAEALVEKTCNGDCTSIDRVVTDRYGECWYAMAVDGAGNKYTYYVNNDGIYLISETKAEKSSTDQKKTTTEEHYEGEPVTIFDSIYAEWHKANGEWYATFVTYNGTQIFAQTAPAGSGWVFYALSNGETVQVVYEYESSNEGAVGPAGVSSHWQELDGTRWF